MKRMYRHIGMALGMLLMLSCSNEPLQEDAPFIPLNPGGEGEKLPPNEQWAWVGAYPGEVNNSVARLNDVEVKIQGNYELREFKFKSAPGYLQSSGLYVPPAEKVVVNYAGGADNLHYRVGIACWELPAGGQYSRYEKVYAGGVLTPGENVLYTNFGGHLYFYFEGMPQGEATVTVSGAVKSPDYALDETELQAWSDAVKDTVSPMIWGELAGRNVIMTLPVRALKQIERPDVFLKYYDKLLETDFHFFGGVKASDFAMPWRIYSDVQLPEEVPGTATKMYAHYPMGYVAYSSDSLEKRLLKLPSSQSLSDTILLQGFADLYKMNWNTGSFSGKYLLKMPVYHFFQRQNKWGELVKSFGTYKKPEERYNLPGESAKMSVAVQLVQQYGWNLLSYIAEKSREEIPEEVPEQYKNDLPAIYASEYANADLTEFFEVWGYPVSEYGRSYMKHYPPLQNRFWETAEATAEPREEPLSPGISYEKICPLQDTVYDPGEWEGTASSSADPVRNLVDGNTGTHWHSVYTGTFDYPHWFQFDFPEPLEFNYVSMVQRNHANPGPKTFKILIKTDPEAEDWVEADNGRIFYLCRDYTGSPVQKNFLNGTVKAYAVRIMLLSGLERTEGGNNPEKYVALAEFSIGLLK